MPEAKLPHGGRGDNYSDYAVEYERIVPVHQAGDRLSHEREPYSRARAGVAPRFVRAVEDIKQLAETFVIDSGTVARKLYSRPVLLARDADDAVAISLLRYFLLLSRRFVIILSSNSSLYTLSNIKTDL